MSKPKKDPLDDWFSNCGGWEPQHNLNTLRKGIRAGLLNEQDEYGMTALSLCVTSSWKKGVDELLKARADTELRYYRTGETALYMAVQEENEEIVASLVAAGASPDAPNYWGLTPRDWDARGELHYFDSIPRADLPLPEPRIQNAEHLADHYHPRFKIPDRTERESMQVGQAVDLYVYGPKSKKKEDAVKVRITTVHGSPQDVRYTATVETPIEKTHLNKRTVELDFGPENIASIYIVKPVKKKGRS